MDQTDPHVTLLWHEIIDNHSKSTFSRSLLSLHYVIHLSFNKSLTEVKHITSTVSIFCRPVTQPKEEIQAIW